MSSGDQSMLETYSVGSPKVGSCQNQQQITSVRSKNCIICGVHLSDAAVYSEEQLLRLKALLEKNDDVFSKHSRFSKSHLFRHNNNWRRI